MIVTILAVAIASAVSFAVGCVIGSRTVRGYGEWSAERILAMAQQPAQWPADQSLDRARMILQAQDADRMKAGTEAELSLMQAQLHPEVMGTSILGEHAGALNRRAGMRAHPEP